MALILLSLIGVLIGWFASIIMHTEDSRGIIQDIGAAIAGSFLIGLPASNFTLLSGLRLIPATVAIVGAGAAIVALYYYRRRNAQE